MTAEHWQQDLGNAIEWWMVGDFANHLENKGPILCPVCNGTKQVNPTEGGASPCSGCDATGEVDIKAAGLVNILAIGAAWGIGKFISQYQLEYDNETKRVRRITSVQAIDKLKP